jgi:hypothetical protein
MAGLRKVRGAFEETHFMRIRKQALAVAMLLTLGAIAVVSVAAQDIPQQIKAPDSERVVLRAHAKGDQVYVCKEDVTQYAWALKEPDAQLFDTTGKSIGKHFAGPSWQLSDGSRVKGEAAAKVDSPDKDSIPWLRVNVVSHEGSGALSQVTTIQRINTKGGKAPAAGCDEAHSTKEVRVAYEADYLFYAPK